MLLKKQKCPSLFHFLPSLLSASFEDVESGNTVGILLSRVLSLEDRDGMCSEGAVWDSGH